MNKVFLDSNVIIDYLAKRAPFEADAKAIFELAKSGKIFLFASALSYSHVAYVMRKLPTKQDVFQTLSDLSRTMSILSVDSVVILGAIQSGFADFEDAI